MSLRNIRLLATYCSKSNIALGSMGVAAGPLNPHRTCMNELCGSWRHYMHVSGLSFFLFADLRRFGPIQSESGHIGRNRSNQVETGFELGWNSSKKINNNTKLNVLNFEATLNQKKKKTLIPLKQQSSLPFLFSHSLSFLSHSLTYGHSLRISTLPHCLSSLFISRPQAH